MTFSTGALLSVTRDTWLPYRLYLAAIAVIVLLIDRGRPDCQVFGTASIAILTVIAGISFRDPLIRGRFDFSYGMYIYAFPIQQLVINRVTGNFWFGMALSIVLTLIAGAASYYLVERRFLHRRMETRAAEPPARGAEGPPLGITAG